MDFLVKPKLSTIKGFSTIEGFLFSEKLLVKPNLSTDEGFFTIEGSTIEGFRCICIHWVQADITALEFE